MAESALITRRAALKALPAGGASLLLPEAAIAAHGEHETETPRAKVTRLAWELAEALNYYADQGFHAVVHPSEQRGDWSVGLFVTRRADGTRGEV